MDAVSVQGEQQVGTSSSVVDVQRLIDTIVAKLPKEEQQKGASINIIITSIIIYLVLRSFEAY